MKTLVAIVKALWDYFKLTHSDSKSMPSWMRFIGSVIIFDVLFNHTYLIVHTGTAQQLDINGIALVLGAIGYKVIQNKQENKANEKNGGATT